MKKKELSNKNCIEAYIHCSKCLKEYMEDEEIRTKVSPKDYAKTQCGFTKEGIQIWCNRHDCNVAHIDFEGVKHPANLTIEKKEQEQ